MAKVDEPLTAYERMKLALFLIGQMKDKTLLGNGRYDEGANAAFSQAAEMAIEALTAVDELEQKGDKRGNQES